jgi:hypothetical protein
MDSFSLDLRSLNIHSIVYRPRISYLKLQICSRKHITRYLTLSMFNEGIKFDYNTRYLKKTARIFSWTLDNLVSAKKTPTFLQRSLQIHSCRALSWCRTAQLGNAHYNRTDVFTESPTNARVLSAAGEAVREIKDGRKSDRWTKWRCLKLHDFARLVLFH